MTAVAVILAAGAGARLGGVAKALLTIDDETYLARIVRTARAAGVEHAVVVIGPPHAAAVGAAARALRLEISTNAAPARGMASSVAVGFTAAASRAVLADATIALLWPVDHPHVLPATVELVLARLDNAPDKVAAIPTRAGRGGHPPAIRRSLWPVLAQSGAQPNGARDVLAAAAERTLRIEVDDPGVIRDVDQPGDVG